MARVSRPWRMGVLVVVVWAAVQLAPVNWPGNLVHAACPCSSNTTQTSCTGPQTGCSWITCPTCSLNNDKSDCTSSAYTSTCCTHTAGYCSGGSSCTNLSRDTCLSADALGCSWTEPTCTTRSGFCSGTTCATPTPIPTATPTSGSGQPGPTNTPRPTTGPSGWLMCGKCSCSDGSTPDRYCTLGCGVAGNTCYCDPACPNSTSCCNDSLQCRDGQTACDNRPYTAQCSHNDQCVAAGYAGACVYTCQTGSPPPGGSTRGVIEGWTSCTEAIGWIETTNPIEIRARDSAGVLRPIYTGPPNVSRPDVPGGVGFHFNISSAGLSGQNTIYLYYNNAIPVNDGDSCWSSAETPNQCNMAEAANVRGVLVGCPSPTPTCAPAERGEGNRLARRLEVTATVAKSASADLVVTTLVVPPRTTEVVTTKQGARAGRLCNGCCGF